MSWLEFLYRATRWGARAFYRLRTRIALRGCEVAGRSYAEGEVKVSGPGRIQIGKDVIFFDGIAPHQLLCDAGAEIVIGDNTLFNYGVFIKAARSVRIGSNCLIASFVTLNDSAAEFENSAPIVIEDNVWIAHGVTIAPGVRIGEGSVVAAGSVVTRGVPANTLAMGAPARCFPLNLMAIDGRDRGDRGVAV